MKPPIEPGGYNPTSWDELLHEQREGRNRGTRPSLSQAGRITHNVGPDLPRKPRKNDAQHLADEFAGLLFGEPAEVPLSASTQNTDSNSSKKILDKNQGTTDPFFSLKEQEQEKKNQPDSFSFSIQNSMAGVIEVSGNVKVGVCRVQLRIEKRLNTRERQVLAQMLKGKLGQILEMTVEMTID